MTPSKKSSFISNISGIFSYIKSVRNNLSQVLSMNRRNLSYIYPHNQRIHYPLADNKLATKQLLKHVDIPLTETYKVYGYFFELKHLEADLSQYSDFVIKPAMGSGGGGIIVIAGKNKNGKGWMGVNGRAYSTDDLKKHISDIIFGIYSFGLHDEAIIEARIQQHPDINIISPYGLADVRIILCQHEQILSMIRLTTTESNGTANLHQGALGVGINIATGVTVNAVLKGKLVNKHPDSGVFLIGVKLPYWQDIIEAAIRVAKQSPLKYIGIDIAISDSGPRLLEINVRPGLEIQNANADGMRKILETKVNIYR